LFEFEGVTSIDMTFSIAFAFMTSEKKDNFVELQGIYHGLALAKNHGPRQVLIESDAFWATDMI
jgi:ribonuclease HI